MLSQKYILFGSLILLIIIGQFIITCKDRTANQMEKWDVSYFENPPTEEHEKPLVFACGVISKGFHELNFSINNDGNRFYYITSDKNYNKYTLVEVTKEDGQWGYPKIPQITAELSIYSCFFSHDHNRLFFSTNKSAIYNGAKLENKNNFYSILDEGKLDTPVLIEDIFEINKWDQICSISKYGNIYLDRKIENRETDIYVSSLLEDNYQKPKPLPGFVNSNFNEARPFISLDESYLIFQSNRPEGYGSNDLYISFKNENGEWNHPINMGENINSAASEFGPTVTPDEKYLFFSSYRDNPNPSQTIRNYTDLMQYFHSPYNGYATLFWVSTAIIEELRNQE